MQYLYFVSKYYLRTPLTDNLQEMPGKVDIDVQSGVTGLAVVALVRELQPYFTVTPLISLHSIPSFSSSHDGDRAITHYEAHNAPSTSRPPSLAVAASTTGNHGESGGGARAVAVASVGSPLACAWHKSQI